MQYLMKSESCVLNTTTKLKVALTIEDISHTLVKLIHIFKAYLPIFLKKFIFMNLRITALLDGKQQ